VVTVATYLSPTDVDFYANHETSVLESLAERLTRDGSYVAANSGADHPIAREVAALLAAVLGQLLTRDLDRILTETAAEAAGDGEA
jgi:hypothetical protein